MRYANNKPACKAALNGQPSNGVVTMQQWRGHHTADEIQQVKNLVISLDYRTSLQISYGKKVEKV